jgi:Ca-activated chloride channel family protein
MTETLNGLSKAELTKAAIIDLVSLRKDDRLGYLYFADKAHLVIAPSLDHVFLKNTFNTIQLEQSSAKASIGSAIAVGVKKLRKSNARGRVLVLFASSADIAGGLGLKTITSLLSNYGVRLYAVVLAPKPEALTSVAENALSKLTYLTGGKYFEVDGALAADLAIKEIDQLEHYSGISPDKMIWQDKYQWPLMFALLFLILEFLGSKTIFRILPN